MPFWKFPSYKVSFIHFVYKNYFVELQPQLCHFKIPYFKVKFVYFLLKECFIQLQSKSVLFWISLLKVNFSIPFGFVVIGNNGIDVFGSGSCVNVWHEPLWSRPIPGSKASNIRHLICQAFTIQRILNISFQIFCLMSVYDTMWATMSTCMGKWKLESTR